jgi:L-2-hydroxyglutarate oxidase LhgO
VGPSRSVQGAKELEAEYPPNGEAVPTRLLTGDEARELEPELSRDIVAALLSSETGIIDSHTFMSSLEEDILESENGELVYSTSVVRVDPYQDASANEDGWVVQVQTSAPGSCSTDTLLARTLINSSGLSAHLILNSLLPLSQRIPMYYARGSYASYRGPGASSVSHLIYPSPFPASPPSQTGATQAHAFQSLGTHLTLDLEGNIKFGPDLQWISPSREGGTERVGTSTSPVTGPVSGRGNHGESASGASFVCSARMYKHALSHVLQHEQR